VSDRRVGERGLKKEELWGTSYANRVGLRREFERKKQARTTACVRNGDSAKGAIVRGTVGTGEPGQDMHSHQVHGGSW